jgi:hypothetical protein
MQERAGAARFLRTGGKGEAIERRQSELQDEMT